MLCVIVLCFFFFLMIRLPPRSTLFLNRVLFRSDRKSTRLNSSHSQIAVFCLDRKSVDRKSTRLNSSHSQISYAVFCLKKKKTKENHAEAVELDQEGRDR